MNEPAAKDIFREWVILELMGHQRAAGMASQAAFPPGFIRLDVPTESGGFSHTRFISPQSVYAFTVVDELAARAAAIGMEQTPVSRWELRQMLPAAMDREDDRYDDDRYDDDLIGVPSCDECGKEGVVLHQDGERRICSSCYDFLSAGFVRRPDEDGVMRWRVPDESEKGSL